MEALYRFLSRYGGSCYLKWVLANQTTRIEGLKLCRNRTSNNLDLGNSVGITEDNTNLRRGGTLLGELADLLHDLLGTSLEPVPVLVISSFFLAEDNLVKLGAERTRWGGS